MRGATQCARRLKRLFTALRSKLGRVGRLSRGDALTQLVLGILSRDVPESKAREALHRIRSVVVDYNELRVVPPIELAEMLGDYPDVRLKCEDASRALNRIFALNHTVSLDQLADMSKREVYAYLEQLDGLEAYSRARIRLLGLHQHAVPLDEAMWAYARQERIVDGRCPLAEAQAFLERRIAEEDALEFVSLLSRQAWAEMGAAVRRREVERILSVPPDRTARNMLQMIGGSLEPGGLPGVAGALPARADAAKAPRPKRAARTRAGRAQKQAKTARKPRAASHKSSGKKKSAPASRTKRKKAKRPHSRLSKKAVKKKTAKAPRRTAVRKAKRERKRVKSA